MLRPLQSTVLAWKCPRCTTNNGISIMRTFTTTISKSETRPESPRYIDIPEAPQQTYPYRAPVKGILPVPRDIFMSRRGGLNKATPEYIERATKQAHPAKLASSAAEKSQNKWKQRMSDCRKRNFREGLLDLQARRQKVVASMAARTQQKQSQRARLLAKAERDDERLTNPSTTALMKPMRREANLPDPNREERLHQIRTNVDAKQARRMEDRRDNLHTLYMHAREFITTESALDRHIEAVFEPPNSNGLSSIWASKAPDSIQTKLNRVNRAGGALMDTDWVPKATKDRIQEIAEQLTGGKISVEKTRGSL